MISKRQFLALGGAAIAVAAVGASSASTISSPPRRVRITVWASNTENGTDWVRVGSNLVESDGSCRIVFDQPVVAKWFRHVVTFDGDSAEIDPASIIEASHNGVRWVGYDPWQSVQNDAPLYIRHATPAGRPVRNMEYDTVPGMRLIRSLLWYG